ncbi:hypothetical protein FQN57_004298 [Myotisia sp. PD_48]|nr:hypothetical protein FQN57_004298 [Myotisia sp. PD_48]
MTTSEQEHISPRMPAVHLPQGPYDASSPPQPSELLYDPEFPTPKPNQEQYLLKIQDAALCRGELAWPEVLSDLRYPHPPIPAHDISGIVLSTPTVDERSAAGPRFKVGDEVFALLAFDRDGGAADCTLAEEHELSFKPQNISFKEAASIPLSSLTAWQAFFQHGNLKYVADKRGYFNGADTEPIIDGADNKLDGDIKQMEPQEQPIRVLITNASGGVGVQALQLLRSRTLFGDQKFWICGTCSSRNASFVKDQLHANEVLDYTVQPNISEAFVANGWQPVDIVLDCIGGLALKQCHSPSVVRDGGLVLSIAHPIVTAWGNLGIQERQLSSKFFIVQPNGKQLEKIAILVEQGEVRGFVDAVFDLHQAKAAMELVESKRVRGKVVLRVNCYTS